MLRRLVCGGLLKFYITQCWILLVGSLWAHSSQAGGFVDFNYYPYMSDVKNDNAVTVNIAASLPNRFSYFSLVNLSSDDSDSDLDELDVYYSEQNLRWQVAEDSPLDLTVQLNFRTGPNNDRHRLGVRWRLSDTPALSELFQNLHLRYAINLHAIQFDHRSEHVWQLEHSFFLKFPYISDRLYLSGFIDHTFNEDLPNHIPANPMVAEAQLGYRLVDNLFVMTEYRLNQYRRSDVNNLTAGIEYKIVW